MHYYYRRSPQYYKTNLLVTIALLALAHLLAAAAPPPGSTNGVRERFLHEAGAPAWRFPLRSATRLLSPPSLESLLLRNGDPAGPDGTCC
eukprot:8606493-Pyramimonas_sp.AAC.2